jgi:hypothetical protein
MPMVARVSICGTPSIRSSTTCLGIRLMLTSYSDFRGTMLLDTFVAPTCASTLLPVWFRPLIDPADTLLPITDMRSLGCSHTTCKGVGIVT